MGVSYVVDDLTAAEVRCLADWSDFCAEAAADDRNWISTAASEYRAARTLRDQLRAMVP